MRKLNIVDMFCGGGGESTGLIEAAHKYGLDVNLSAINHWERAIETHAANYPFAEHRCENVQHIKPRTLSAARNTDLMWASPACQHFSVARGKQPKNEQMRSPAWEVLRFAEELRPKRIIIENVPEFQSWGPLDDGGKIIPQLKGATFMAFICGLQSLNYVVDYRVLCAADYGAPTSRKRLFIQAVRMDCGKRILWPEKSNTQNVAGTKPWRTAAEIIDWSVPCQLISERKKPLAEATMKRIEYGIKAYWGEYAEPFIARLYGTSKAESIHKPLSTISCSGAHHMLIQPFLTRYNGGDGRVHRITESVPTLDTSNRYGIMNPFIAEYYGNGGVHPVSVPLPTITTKDRFAVCGTAGGVELGFRMLQPHELAAATGFPKEYRFTGNKSEIVKQIGNAVPPNFASAMLSKILEKTGE